ncbi:MAG: PKD domain-containing protein [Desulfosalsimonadaceae bacterium]|nr:PKD domain-containing protein [Desulfosalsimonadaceae bacterium]
MSVSPTGSGVVYAHDNLRPPTEKYFPPETTATCFSVNQTVVLQANPKSGFKFSRWAITGATKYSGTANPYSITMPRDLTATRVIAYFTGNTAPVLPVANAGSDQTVKEGVKVTLDGTKSSDADGTIASYRWAQIDGQQVTLSSLTASKPTFTSPYIKGGDTLIFQLTVTDNDGNTDTDTVNIIVQWTDTSTLTADAGQDQKVLPGDTVTLDGSGSKDSGGLSIDYQWEISRASIDTSGISLSNPTGKTTSFTAPQVNGWIEFKLTVTNTGGDVDTALVMITIGNVVEETDLVADAGSDLMVVSGNQVQLTGSWTSPEGVTVTYQWEKTSGPVISLSGSDEMAPETTREINPTFKAPEISTDHEEVVLQFIVKDAGGTFGTDTDDVEVTVVSRDYVLNNKPPVADAGPDQATAPGAQVSLDASDSSDPENKPLLYRWTLISGSGSIALSDASIAKPTFVVPSGSGSATFEVLVTDDAAKTDTDTVVVTWTNAAPTADAGPDQNVFEGDTVALYGSGSSDDEGIASYHWSQLSGPAATLSDASEADPEFSAPAVVTGSAILTFELTVTDGGGQTDKDQVQITVNDKNTAPIADAGDDQRVNETANVVLSGSGSSDPDGDTLSYHWIQTSGPVVVMLPGSSLDAESMTFAAPSISDAATPAKVIFQLTVSDPQGLSGTDRIEILIDDVGAAPVADAGDDQRVYENRTITLDGTGSMDSDGTISGYLWSQTSGPTVILSDVSSANPTFTAPSVTSDPVILTFLLAVEDDEGLVAYDDVALTVYPDAEAPIADAGPDQLVDERTLVILDGSASSDSDDGIKSYLWEQEDGVGVVLSNTSAVKPEFEAPKISEKTVTLNFKLTVEDYNGKKHADSVAITVDNKSSHDSGCFISSVAD